MFLTLALCLGQPLVVENKCPITVTNKCPSPPSLSPKGGGYPVRGGWWTGCGNWTHMASGQHAGKFPVEWLKSLSNAEVQSLHSDDHEGRVKWSYVPARSSRPVAPSPAFAYTSPLNCPTGR